MADEPVVAVAAQETAPIVSEPAPEPDYKAQLAELQTKIAQAQAENAKLGQQVASYRGVAGQKLDYEAEARRVNRHLERLSEAVDTLLDTQSNGDETVAQKVATLRQKRAQEEQLDETQQQTLGLWTRVGRNIGEAYDLPFDPAAPPKVFEAQSAAVWHKLETEPALQEAFGLAYRARQTNNNSLLNQALDAVEEVRRGVQMTAHEKKVAEAKAAAKKEAEEAAQEKLRESGVLSMPGAKPAGAGGSIDNYIQRLRKGEALPSPAEIDRLTAAYTK